VNQRIAERIWPILTSKPALVFYAGLCCFLLAIFNIFIAEHNNFISIWMVNAVLLIFIFRSKPALSWYYFLAGLIATTLANLVAGGPLLISFQVALCNSLEILIPILLVQRSVESPVLINSFNRQVIALAYALPLGCLCSALTVTMLTNEPSNPYTPVIILNWFSIDLLAMISILPIGLSATYDRFKKLIQPRKMLELILSVTVAVLLTWVSMRYIQIRFIIMLIPLLYGTFRLGLLGTSIMCFSITAVFAVNLIISQTNHQLYSTIPELISYSFLLMSITLMPALITAILIEQRDLFQDKLGENEELFRGVILYSSIGMALVSPDGKWTLVNPALSDITGYDQDELLKMKLEDITNKEYVLHDSDMVSRVIKHDILSYQVDKRCIKKNGETIWVSQVIYGIYDAAGKIINYVIQIEDITLRKQLQLQLKNQATHDMLTGLTNRREIENKIQVMLQATIY
jgi:PAS domain S-box-containing protein